MAVSTGKFFYSRLLIQCCVVREKEAVRELWLRTWKKEKGSKGHFKKEWALCIEFLNIFKSRPWRKSITFRQSLFSLLLCFFTFFFPSTLTLYQERLTLYTATLTDEHRVTLSFSPSSPSLSHHVMGNPSQFFFQVHSLFLCRLSSQCSFK
jgi:hypothetical protein